MKKFFKNLTDMQKMVFVSIVVGVILCLFALIGLAYGQPGWIIGVSIGSAIEAINIFFLYKGSDVCLKESRTPLFLLFYFARMLLFAGGIILCVIMQFSLQIEAFKNSFWGVLIGYTPMQVIVVVIMAKTGKSPLNMRNDIDNE